MSTLFLDVRWRDQGAAAGLRGLSAATKQTRQGFDEMRAATARAAGAVKKARLDQIDAARSVAVQEARLKEARDSGKAKASQILAIEDRLATARRKEADATDAAKRAVNDLRQAQEREEAASRKSSKAVAAAAQGLRGLRSGLQGFHSVLVKADGYLGKFARNVGHMGVGLAKVGAVGFGALAAGAVALGTKAVSSAGKFDASMRLVATTTGETGKGMRGLTKLALEMGAKTSFSAQGASDAMLALARGGMTAAQIKAGALKNTLTLATAGGLELGDAANYMVQGLSAFGLKAKDAGQVSAALAGAANASTSSVEDMGLALSQVGSGAKTAGLSIQDTTAALAAFSNAGVKGSDAGTALKTFLQRLVPATEKTRDAMKELGLITKDGSNKFFDAKGNVKSMADVAGTLQEALKGQTREQKIATLTTIFGSDASRAAAILADEGAKGVTKYTKATSDKAAAENLAKTATQGYAGAMERFKGAVETAGVQVGTKLLPTATKLLNFLSGPGIEALTSFGGSVSHIAGPVFKAFMSGLTGGTGSFKDFADYLKTHQADIVGGFVSFGKGAIEFGIVLARVISGGIRMFGSFADAIGQFTSDQVDNMGHFLNVATAAFGWLPDLGPKLQAANINFALFAGNARTNIHKSGNAARGFADGLDNKLIPALGRAGRTLDEVGRKEIVKAQQRDNAAKAALAIEGIGQKSDYARLKLKGFNWETATGSKGQWAFRQRLNAARAALQEQYNAALTAGAGHKTLNGILKTARDRLRDEFIQMGFTTRQAGKLADQVTRIPKNHATKYTTPGGRKAREDAAALKRRLEEIPNRRDVKINFSTNAAGVAGKFNVNFANSRELTVKRRAAGGIITGPGTGTSDSILGLGAGGVATARVSNGEFVVNARQTARHRGTLEALNAGLAGFADGGLISRVAAAHHMPDMGAVPAAFGVIGDRVIRGVGQAVGAAILKQLERAASGAFGGVGAFGVGRLAQNALARVGQAWDIGTCLRFVRMMAGAPGGTYDATAAWSNARYKHRGDRNAPSGVPMYWGGGHGHIAVSVGGGKIVGTDFPRTGRIGLASASRITPSWGKPYLGWANDVNGVVTSRYGLSSGGVVGVGVGEHGPERVLSAAQTRTFDRMVRVMDSRGAGNTYVVNISAPNYIGSRQELRKTLVDMTRSGAFEVVKR